MSANVFSLPRFLSPIFVFQFRFYFIVSYFVLFVHDFPQLSCLSVLFFPSFFLAFSHVFSLFLPFPPLSSPFLPSCPFISLCLYFPPLSPFLPIFSTLLLLSPHCSFCFFSDFELQSLVSDDGARASSFVQAKRLVRRGGAVRYLISRKKTMILCLPLA